MTAKVVLLNGAGSAGKTSIAKAIQLQATRFFLHVQMDAFLEMMPPGSFGRREVYHFETVITDGKPVTIVHSGPEMHRTMNAMRHAVAGMAVVGCNIVIDDVMIDDVSSEYRALLAPFDFHTVGVMAPLDVLEEREAARGDRELGLARSQFGLVHRGRTYDMEVDTSKASAVECAAAIVKRFGL